jgi:hypothetical protein
MSNRLISSKVSNIIQDLTINTTYTSSSTDVSNLEDGYSYAIGWTNGASLDVDITLQVSLDDENYVTVTDSTQNITDNIGTHIYDVTGTSIRYARIVLTVNSGSADFTIKFNGKSRS